QESLKRFGSRLPLVAEAFGIDTSTLPARPKTPRRPKKPVPPPPPPAKSEAPAVEKAEEVEEVERPLENDVAVEPAGTDVPAGDDEATADDAGAPPIVLGVTDDDDVPPESSERVEHRTELLRSTEVVGEHRNGRLPSQSRTS